MTGEPHDALGEGALQHPFTFETDFISRAPGERLPHIGSGMDCHTSIRDTTTSGCQGFGETLQSLDTKRGGHGFGAMSNLSDDTPFQRLVPKCQELWPASVVTLRIYESLYLGSSIDAREASKIV